MVELQGEEKPAAVSLAESLGASDVLVLDMETAARLFTENRLEILRVVKEEEPASIRELARTVERNVNAVMRDLKDLYEMDVIRFEEESNRKMPRMRHDAVAVEPVV